MPRLKNHPDNIAANASTRARLLAAACEEFVGNGYYATDTNKIAERADLAPATFYRHFKNKAEIFTVVLEQQVAEEAQELARRGLDCYRATGSLDEAAKISAQLLIESRRRLAKLRLDAETILATDDALVQARLAARRSIIKTLKEFAAVVGATVCPDEELHVRMHVINSLADAIARGQFELNGVTPETAMRELIAQWKACFLR